MKASIKNYLIGIVIILVIFIPILVTVRPFIVQETSMAPNISDGQRIIVNKTSYWLHPPERGDIVVFRELDSSLFLIKRIIGLPGEMVKIHSGVVYINGTPLHEPYLKELPRYEFTPQIISEGHYFVLGDDRSNSDDSHLGWTVPEANIFGKVCLLVGSPIKFSLVTNRIPSSD